MSKNQENFKRGCTEILVLYLLTKEDLYGYQITQLFKEKSDGRFTISSVVFLISVSASSSWRVVSSCATACALGLDSSQKRPL